MSYKQAIETLGHIYMHLDKSPRNVLAFSELAETLHRSARRIDRDNLIMCNGIPRYCPNTRQIINTWTEEDDARRDKYREKARRLITGAMYEAGLDPKEITVSLQGDPRGAAIILAHNGREWRF